VPTLTSVNPTSGGLGQTLNVTLTGTNFAADTTCDFGPGVTVTSCIASSSTTLVATITVSSTAALGENTVKVTNAAGQSASLPNSFMIRQTSSFPPPSLTSVSPDHADQGQNLNVVLTGSNFQSGATCNFGSSVNVSSCTFNSSTQLTAAITVSASATPGTTAVTVTNPDQ